MGNGKVGSEFVVVCALCQKPTPVGRTFCQHCWSLLRGRVVSIKELEEEIRLQSLRKRLRRRARLLTIGLSTLVFIVSVVCVALYYCTDVLVKPPSWLNSSSASGQWAMFRYDLGRSGCSEPAHILPQGVVKWVFRSGAAVYSSPAIAEGTVYFGSRDHRLYAVDATTGAKRWEYETGSWVESSPVVVGGIVYFGSNDGKLYAVRADTGEKLWEFMTGYPVRSSPAVANNKVVYFGADDYSVYAVRTKNGVKLWQLSTNGCVTSSPAVSGGVVYVGSNDGFCYAVDAMSGRLRLRFKAYSPVSSSPAVDNGVVYCATFSGRLLSFDGTARNLPWEHEIKPYWLQAYAFGLPVPQPPPQSGFIWGAKIASRIESSPTVADGKLFVGTSNRLIAIDLATKQKLWEFVPDGAMAGSVAVCGGNVYMGSSKGTLYALDASTGVAVWRLQLGSPATSSPSVSRGVIYIGLEDGSLYAVE